MNKKFGKTLKKEAEKNGRRRRKTGEKRKYKKK